MKITKIIENIVRKVGELPPEPPPDAQDIAREHLPPIVKELVSSDRQFVIIITVNKNIFRAHSFQWLTHADDDVWNAFWTEYTLDTVTDSLSVIESEAEQRIDEYEKQQKMPNQEDKPARKRR